MAEHIVPESELIEVGCARYKELFKLEAKVIACAPGRVNLIGEHTDYNNGFVFPMALPMLTIVIGGPNESNTCYVHTLSENIPANKEVSFQVPSVQPLKPAEPRWANYIKGVVAFFPGKVPGFNAVIISSVPFGGGLSSSAAVEVSMFTFLEALTGISDIGEKDKALICQKAEHEFAKVPCGIMDQFISVMGKEGCALLIDCKTNEGTLYPIHDSSLIILITNTGVKHNLAGSEFAKRRGQCEEVAKLLRIPSLREASMEMLGEANAKNPLPPELMHRAKHVIQEIKRTYEAALALNAKDYPSFGHLMCQSHYSLRDDYQVSCPELDQIVEIAMSCDGVYGCRMTGGGFGGCTVALLKKEALQPTIDAIKARYSGKPTFYVVTPSKGAHVCHS